VNDSHLPDPAVTRKTFGAEAVRALASGVLETALATFAIVIAVKQFESGPGVKAVLMASQAIGLIGGVVVIPLFKRRRFRANRAAALVHFVSMGGFVLAATGARSEWCFVVGTSFGIGVIGMAIPLQAHYLRLNYPGATRGRLFSINIVLRALAAIVASWMLGHYLDEDLGRYVHLLWIFAAAAGVAGLVQWTIPSVPFEGERGRASSVVPAMRWLREDRVFARVIVAFMMMGIGVLSANALRVDYLVNPEHGVALDVVTVSFVTGILPSVARLVSTFFWGWLFDRIDFFRLRLILNGVFLAGILCYFGSRELPLIVTGTILFGLARGGGEIMFNLFVTRFADPAHVTEYMSVHTFFAGLRTLAAPFLGFFLVQYADVSAMLILSSVCVGSTFYILWPMIGMGRDSPNRQRG